MKRVVIVGGGAAGVWQAACLAQSGITDITIVEPSSRLGVGAAYATDNPDHLLNVTPDKMDAHPVPGYETFVSWLERQATPPTGPHCARGQFGAYMDEIVRTLGRRARIQHIRAKVAGLARDAAGVFSVALDNGTLLFADRVILAIGNLPPRRLAPRLSHERIIEDPWRLQADVLAAARDVVIAGTGLTATDVAISIHQAAPGARIVLAANRSFMPPADATTATWVGADAIPNARPSRVWQHVMREIRSVADADHWISVIEATKSHAPRIWHSWSPRDRATFVRHGLRHWLHHRHRMPAASFAFIQTLVVADRLAVARGRIGNLAIEGNKVCLTIGDQPVIADVVVNATGPSVNIEDDTLLRQIAAQGLIRADGYGLGLAVERSGQAIGTDGDAVPGLWILGAWTRGTHFEVVAVPLLRKHAALIADSIASLRG